MTEGNFPITELGNLCAIKTVVAFYRDQQITRRTFANMSGATIAEIHLLEKIAIFYHKVQDFPLHRLREIAQNAGVDIENFLTIW